MNSVPVMLPGMTRLLLLAALALPAASETVTPGTLRSPENVARTPRDGKGRVLWRVSQAAFVAGRVADTASSLSASRRGGRELNPLLANADGSFGARGVAIQAGISAAWLAGQELIVRKWGRHGWVRKAVTAVNFTGAAVGFGAAGHNWRRKP